jgi:hypothetical protein
VTEHDVLVGYRLRLFTLAAELGNVSAACRAMGVDRSTYYRLKRRVDRWGLEALNVRERRETVRPSVCEAVVTGWVVVSRGCGLRSGS